MDENIGSQVIMDDEKIVGIVTERDYARNVILTGTASSTTLVRDIMSTRVVCAGLEQSVEECMAVMIDKARSHLPVLESKRLAGVQNFIELALDHFADAHAGTLGFHEAADKQPSLPGGPACRTGPSGAADIPPPVVSFRLARLDLHALVGVEARANDAAAGFGLAGHQQQRVPSDYQLIR